MLLDDNDININKNKEKCFFLIKNPSDLYPLSFLVYYGNAYICYSVLHREYLWEDHVQLQIDRIAIHLLIIKKGKCQEMHLS